jgi:hypothetical protein
MHMARTKWLALCCAALALTALSAVPAAATIATTSSGNLIVNGDAEAGYCTTDWHAATTIPGWTINSGSPDVICYSAGSFSLPAGPASGTAFLAPGDQGDGSIAQTVDVSSAAPAIDGGGVTFDLSGWLGGWTSYAGYTVVSARFMDGAAHQLGSVVNLPTVSAADRGNQTGFLARDGAGSVPAGTRSILVGVQFVNSAGESGYADNLSLTLSTPVSQPRLTPPPSDVPAYDHVFMVMMENTNYSAVINDTTDMPYLHSLMAQGTTMTNYHAVYHPSDENYLAVSGGDTFARGATYWPNINDPATNIGDTLEANGKSWKAYEQGMGTPCNTSKQYDANYFPDDAPFINYADVSGNTARCQAHLFDTSQLTTDLKSASTTPAFSWVAADDYYDGEASGNGNTTSLRVQDGWLSQTIAPILSSPAWTSQRSLLLLTWDEDTSDPGNHVATVVVGSQGTVPAQRQSNSRYDHYGTGRTIEAALGLPPITANDRYAIPLNDAFTGSGSSASSALTTGTPTIAAGSPITFSYSTPPGTLSSTNWIGIYPIGVTPGQQASLTWQYAPGGAVTFGASSLPGAGHYAAWYCYNDGYSVLAGPLDVTIN